MKYPSLLNPLDIRIVIYDLVIMSREATLKTNILDPAWVVYSEGFSFMSSTIPQSGPIERDGSSFMFQLYHNMALRRRTL